MSEALPMVIDALQFAAVKHQHQRRKDAARTPYINHPITLLHVLQHTGQISDPVVLISALLHDTVEDTETTFDEITARFGEAVAAVVAQVTDDKSLPKAARKQHQVDHAAHLCDRAKLVKLADKIANLRDLVASPPADWPPQRCHDYCQWAKQVVDGLRGIHPGLEAEFERIYATAIAQFPALATDSH